MTPIAAYRGVRPDEGEARLGMFLDHIGDDPGPGGVAALAEGSELRAMNIRMAIEALAAFARELEG